MLRHFVIKKPLLIYFLDNNKNTIILKKGWYRLFNDFGNLAVFVNIVEMPGNLQLSTDSTIGLKNPYVF